MSARKFSNRIFSLISLVLLVAGCSTTRYEYVAPRTDQGRYCATQCAAIKESCEGNEINRANAERYACEQRSEYQYHDCRRHADSDEEAKRCFRPACWSNPNTWRCDENYRQCFVSCGGTVHMFKE